jgi:hypothetical protein
LVEVVREGRAASAVAVQRLVVLAVPVVGILR